MGGKGQAPTLETPNKSKEHNNGTTENLHRQKRNHLRPLHQRKEGHSKGQQMLWNKGMQVKSLNKTFLFYYNGQLKSTK